MLPKLLKHAQDKYIDRTRQGNNVWGSSSQREGELVALSAQVNKLRGDLKLKQNIAAKQTRQDTRNKQ